MVERVLGRIPALECLRAKKRAARTLYLLRGAKGLDALRAAAGNVPVRECDRELLDGLAAGTAHQGVVLEADPLPIANADRWTRESFPHECVVVVLDGIEDPHNFGAIARSAAACGSYGIVFGKDRAAPVSPATVKSAAGGMEYIELVRATNLARTLRALKNQGFWLAGLDAAADQVLWDADLTGRVAFVVGSEGAGIRPGIQKLCDFHLRIPLTGPITSLNASVSAAIALVECMRQRQPRGVDR